jgi:hypothetical protein
MKNLSAGLCLHSNLLLSIMFIFFRVEENEPKEDARAPLNPARR